MLLSLPVASAQTSIVQSNIGSGCSSVCINGNCTTSCKGEETEIRKGSGQLESKSYALSGFDTVVSQGIDTVINSGEQFAVKVTSDSQLLEYVEVRKRGDVLEIFLVPGHYESTSFKVDITMPSLRSVSQRGVTRLTVNGFIEPEMEVIMQGAGEVRGTGSEFANLVLHSQGTGSLDLTGSKISNAELHAAGAVNIRLAFGEKAGQISGEMLGASELSYCGTPENTITISGVADIRRTSCNNE